MTSRPLLALWVHVLAGESLFKGADWLFLCTAVLHLHALLFSFRTASNKELRVNRGCLHQLLFSLAQQTQDCIYYLEFAHTKSTKQPQRSGLRSWNGNIMLPLILCYHIMLQQEKERILVITQIQWKNTHI